MIFGKILCMVICLDYILLAILDYFCPREDIDIAPKFELGRWQEVSRPRPQAARTSKDPAKFPFS